MKDRTIDLPDRTTLVAFVAVALIGGINLVAVKFSNKELAPMFGAALRFSAAAALLFVVVAVKRIPLPRGRSLIGALLYGTLGFTVFYALGYWALLELSSGVAAVVLASVPLLTLIFASLHRVERLHARGLLGAMLAIAGIAVLMSGPSGSQLAVLPLMAALGAATAAAESGVVLKMFPPSHPVATNAVAMGVGSVFLFLFSASFGEPWILPETSTTWVAFAYLVILGSVGLFALYLFSLKRWTASGVSYLFVLMPIVAAVAGALLLGEPITTTLLVGGTIVVAGVYVGALSGNLRVRRAGAVQVATTEETATA
jgi:drug/metabolite transporter (DMT)-like permease